MSRYGRLPSTWAWGTALILSKLHSFTQLSVILQQVEKQPERPAGRDLVLTPNARHVVDDGHRRERPDESLVFDEIRGIDMKNQFPAQLLQRGQMLAQMVLAAGPVGTIISSTRAAYPASAIVRSDWSLKEEFMFAMPRAESPSFGDGIQNDAVVVSAEVNGRASRKLGPAQAR